MLLYSKLCNSKKVDIFCIIMYINKRLSFSWYIQWYKNHTCAHKKETTIERKKCKRDHKHNIETTITLFMYERVRYIIIHIYTDSIFLYTFGNLFLNILYFRVLLVIHVLLLVNARLKFPKKQFFSSSSSRISHSAKLHTLK